jgi:hypothetical protein
MRFPGNRYQGRRRRAQVLRRSDGTEKVGGQGRRSAQTPGRRFGVARAWSEVIAGARDVEVNEVKVNVKK